VIARFWSDEGFRQQIANTIKLEKMDVRHYDAIFFAGGHGSANPQNLVFSWQFFMKQAFTIAFRKC